MCDASGGTVAVGNGETCLDDWWIIRDLFSINTFHEVILLKARFSKQRKLFIHLNNGGYSSIEHFNAFAEGLW